MILIHRRSTSLHPKISSILFFLIIGVVLTIISCRSGELTNDAYSGSDLKMLADLNTNHNGGRTVRFESSNIDVYIAMPDFNANMKKKIEAWETASGGRINFQYTRSRVSEGIEIYSFFQMPGTCGSTAPDHDNGVIKKSVIVLDPISYISICSETLKHEIGHSIGLLAHTDDNGLMDKEGGDGDISPQIERIIKTIYNYPSDTPIGNITIVQ